MKGLGALMSLNSRLMMLKTEGLELYMSALCVSIGIGGLFEMAMGVGYH